MLRAHETPLVLTLAVSGPATMMESPTVNEAALLRITAGVREVRLDLRDCTAMDSTFSGTMLSLKRRLERHGGKLTLVSPSPKVLELLEQMGLEDFYPIEEAPRVDGAWRELMPSSASPLDLSKLVLESHEELSRVPGPANAAFRAVVDELRRDASAGQPATRRGNATS